MDILISSNLERYLFELFGREARAVAYCMYRLNEGGEYSVTAEALDQIREEFAAYSCDDQKTLDTIREIHDRCGYVMDTHTAVAVNALEQYQQETGDRTPALVVSTASRSSLRTASSQHWTARYRQGSLTACGRFPK